MNMSYSKCDAEGIKPSIISLFMQVVDPIHQALGNHSEIVLHDLRNTDHSIVALAGNVTDRTVGGVMSEIGLSLAAQGEDAEDKINYLTTTASGKLIRSTTILLRDGSSEQPIAALCINVDITTLQAAANILRDLTLPGPHMEHSPDAMKSTVFADDPEAIINDILQGALVESRTVGTPGEKENRQQIVSELLDAGVFGFRRSVPYIAQQLSVSRATIYADIAHVRQWNGKRGRRNWPNSSEHTTSESE